MFGNDEDKDQASTNDSGAPMPPSEPIADGTLTTDGTSTTVVSPTSDDDVSHGSPIGDPTPPPDTPLINSDAPAKDDSEDEARAEPAEDTDSKSDEPAASPSPADGDLLRIKQDALQELGPLVDHLDQSPEEKFRTKMMMIQANDDQSLISDAYDAAKQISDDKERAQALLDIINEINYFTQQDKLNA